MQDDKFQEVVEGFYAEGDKSEGEFNLGLGLAALMDSMEHPELYDEQSIQGIFDHIDTALASWRFKYNKEILELHDGS